MKTEIQRILSLCAPLKNLSEGSKYILSAFWKKKSDPPPPNSKTLFPSGVQIKKKHPQAEMVEE